MKLGVNEGVSVWRAHEHETPVTLCREQSIRGYVSKESMFAGAGGVCWVGKSYIKRSFLP